LPPRKRELKQKAVNDRLAALTKTQVSIISMLTGVKSLALNTEESLLKKRPAPQDLAEEEEIVTKVVQEEVKEPVSMKDLGNAFGEDGDNIMSLKKRFAKEG
jgi:hypothetical protein